MKIIIRISLLLVISLAVLFPRLAWSNEPLREAQIWACRAASSLLLVRGEGQQERHIARIDQDLDNARLALKQLSGVDRQRLMLILNTLRDVLVQGVEAGPEEEDLPWRYPQWLSQALSAFLLATEETLPASADGMERVALEFLTVQYLSKSYIGTYELSREHKDMFIGQDEMILVPVIDEYMSAEALNNKDVARWQFIRKALADLNSRSSTWASVSGKPFVPLMVDYYVRSLGGS